MTSVEEREHQKHRERHFFIPAGVLIGLGVGIIAGHVASGVLIGLGLGFLAQALYKSDRGPVPDPAAPCCGHSNRWISVLVGVFMIVIGIGIIWSPVDLWPYIIGIFLILLGIMIAAKSFGKGS